MNNLAEVKFKEWLDKNHIPYWYVDQSLDSFSLALRRYMIKRPDFMILLPNVGFIFVDVKDKKQGDMHDKFFLDGLEVDKYSEMQMNFNIRTWFAISHEIYHYKTWFWIPVSNVAKSGLIFDSRKSGDKAYSVPINEFVQVSDDDNLERIFSKLFRF